MSVLTLFFLMCVPFLVLAEEELKDVKVDIIKEGRDCKNLLNIARPGDYLEVHYTGRFNDENGEIFDTSRQRGQLYHFQLGAGHVCIYFKKFYKQITILVYTILSRKLSLSLDFYRLSRKSSLYLMLESRKPKLNNMSRIKL